MVAEPRTDPVEVILKAKVKVQRTGSAKVTRKARGKVIPLILAQEMLNLRCRLRSVQYNMLSSLRSKLLGSLLSCLLRSQPRNPQQLPLRYLLLKAKVRAAGKAKVRGKVIPLMLVLAILSLRFRLRSV